MSSSITHQEVKTMGTAAVWLSPWHGCPWEVVDLELCREDIGFPYLHIFCTSEGLRRKKELATDIGVWFIDQHASLLVDRRPGGHFWSAPWRDLVVPAEAHMGKHFCLPCSETPKCREMAMNPFRQVQARQVQAMCASNSVTKWPTAGHVSAQYLPHLSAIAAAKMCIGGTGQTGPLPLYEGALSPLSSQYKAWH